MNNQTEPPMTPALKIKSRKIVLYIALGLTLASFVCFGISMKQEKDKETYQILGGICLVSGAILLFVAALQSCFSGNSNTTESLNSPTPTPLPPTQKSQKKGVLIIISADSWCGFSKKMSAEAPALKSLLEPMGIEVVLVSDMQDKDAFQKLATEHSARGFPHSVLIVGDAKLADIPGYVPAPKMQEMVAAKL